jgi:hypothetical protein
MSIFLNQSSALNAVFVLGTPVGKTSSAASLVHFAEALCALLLLPPLLLLLLLLHGVLVRRFHLHTYRRLDEMKMRRQRTVIVRHQLLSLLCCIDAASKRVLSDFPRILEALHERSSRLWALAVYSFCPSRCCDV